MENCVAPGLDTFQSIIRSCIVFGQSSSFPADGHTSILNKMNNKSKTNRKRTNIVN